MHHYNLFKQVELYQPSVGEFTDDGTNLAMIGVGRWLPGGAGAAATLERHRHDLACDPVR